LIIDKEWLRSEMEEMAGAGGYYNPRVCLYYPASVHKVGPHNLSPIVKLINNPVFTYIVCQSITSTSSE
jgi:hypothetical protein